MKSNLTVSEIFDKFLIEATKWLKALKETEVKDEN